MGKKLGVIIGVLIALSTVVILLGSQETKPKQATKEKKVKAVPPWVKEYQECPLSLRKYGKAFYDLGKQRWQERDLENALKCFETAGKIYGDIINVQNRRSKDEKKLRSYRTLTRLLTEARLKALFAKAQVLLLLNKRKDALRELLNIARICGSKSPFLQGDESRKLLKEVFHLTEEDMRDLGLELLR